MSRAGRFTIEISQQHAKLYDGDRDNDENFNREHFATRMHVHELLDLRYAVDKAIREARAELGARRYAPELFDDGGDPK